MKDNITNAKKLNALDMPKWQKLISDWEQSSENQKAFCERLGLSLNTFTYVRAKLSAKQKTHHFIPVTLKKESHLPAYPEQLILENKSGLKVYVPMNLAEDRLAILINLIGRHDA